MSLHVYAGQVVLKIGSSLMDTMRSGRNHLQLSAGQHVRIDGSSDAPNAQVGGTVGRSEGDARGRSVSVCVAVVCSIATHR